MSPTTLPLWMEAGKVEGAAETVDEVLEEALT